MSSFLNIPRPFYKSCQQHAAYPTKLVDRVRYGFPRLQSCQERFQSRQKELNLFAPVDKFFVPHWDVLEDGTVDQKNLKSEEQLSKLLGDQFGLHPSDPGSGPARVVAVKPDPQFRIIFLVSASSVAPVEITASALKRILNYYQVMPYFPDFLYTYGPRNGNERESTRFSGFRTEKTLDNVKPALDIPTLNRSGKRYQMCCTLKSTSRAAPEAGSDGSKTPQTWRVRSAVIYHQFDIEYGTQFWIVGDPLQSLHELIQEHVHDKKNHSERFKTPLQSFKTSLEMLLHFFQWATDEWRWRVQFSEERVERITQHYVDIDPEHPNRRWDKDGMLFIQKEIENLTDAVTCIESNIAVQTRCQRLYTDLIDDPAWPQSDIRAYGQTVKDFVSQVDEHVYDLSMQLQRANLALQMGKNRKDILIQHLAAQNAAKQESHTMVMWDQQHKTGLDAVAMKIITVITLFYLPATFVSTFFSTDVLKYQPEDAESVAVSSTTTSTPVPSSLPPSPPSKEQYSPLALERFFTLSIPLMAVTFACAVAWYAWEKRNMNKRREKDKMMWAV